MHALRPRNPLAIRGIDGHALRVKRILYASGGFLTDDAIAEAIMEYASVLAIVNSADVIDCAGVDESGEVRRMQMLVGPSSQILTMETDEPQVDMEVDETVSELRRRSRLRLPTDIDVADSGRAPAESDAEATSH